MQAWIARIQEFQDGELLGRFNSITVTNFAERLVQKYFPKTERLAMRKDILDLYRSLLVLAPVIQRERRAFRLDWHRGHLLTRIRQRANRRGKYFWIGCSEEPRVVDEERMMRNLSALGIRDTVFCDNVLKDMFRSNYGLDVARGRIANVLFDGVMFHGVGEGNCLRVGNRFYRIEREEFQGAVDIRQDYASIWDYRVRFEEVAGGGRITILLAEERVKSFRDRVKSILRSSAAPGFKILLLERAVRDFVEDARYAKSALIQMLDLSRWLKQKVRTLSGTERDARRLPGLLLELYRERSGDRFYVNRPNFFWDPNRVPLEVYMTFFSPYRET